MLEQGTCTHCGEIFTQEGPRAPYKMCFTCRELLRQFSARRDRDIGSSRVRLTRAKKLAHDPSAPIDVMTGALGDPQTFRDSFCTDDSRGRIPVMELWTRYQRWCIEQSLVPMRRQDFVEGVMGYQYGLSTSTPKSVVGLRWKED